MSATGRAAGSGNGQGPVTAPLQWIDDRVGAASVTRKAIRKVFPDHWSFLLGEVALFSFVILILTGTYLTFFFVDSSDPTIYTGSYKPLDGQSMSLAYNSVMRLSFDVRFGLLIRQMHHWAALLFVVAIAVHLCRIFFTGAFRKPRELNYLIGITLLLLALLEGFSGYSLPDDLLSGTGIRIAYSVILSIPVIGTWVAFLVFGGKFPTNVLIPRLFIAHVFLIPGALVALISVHLALLVINKHTQYRRPGHTERNVVGKYFWPEQVFKSTALTLIIGGVIAALGGLIQINPIWQYGPYVPYIVSSPAQPDWYIGWLDGLLRLGGPWGFTFFGYYVSEIFWPGVVVPGIAFTLMMAWPFIEERFITKDRMPHHVLDRPRDNPIRTATGAAGIMVFFVTFLEGGNDVLAVLFQVPVEWLTRILQVGFIVGPIITWFVTYRVCVGLKRSEFRPARVNAGLRLRRTPAGGYETVPLDPPAVE